MIISLIFNTLSATQDAPSYQPSFARRALFAATCLLTAGVNAGATETSNQLVPIHTHHQTPAEFFKNVFGTTCTSNATHYICEKPSAITLEGRTIRNAHGRVVKMKSKAVDGVADVLNRLGRKPEDYPFSQCNATACTHEIAEEDDQELWDSRIQILQKDPLIKAVENLGISVVRQNGDNIVFEFGRLSPYLTIPEAIEKNTPAAILKDEMAAYLTGVFQSNFVAKREIDGSCSVYYLSTPKFDTVLQTAQNKQNIIFVLDVSGSMLVYPNFPEITQEAFRYVLEQPTTDQVRVISFNDKVTDHGTIGLNNYTAINLLRSGSTALYDAMLHAFVTANSTNDNRLKIVALSDGLDNQSGFEARNNFENHMKYLSTRPYRPEVISFGLGDQADVNTLRTITTSSAGRQFEIRQPEEVRGHLAQVFRSQAVLPSRVYPIKVGEQITPVRVCTENGFQSFKVMGDDVLIDGQKVLMLGNTAARDGKL